MCRHGDVGRRGDGSALTRVRPDVHPLPGRLHHRRQSPVGVVLVEERPAVRALATRQQTAASAPVPEADGGAAWRRHAVQLAELVDGQGDAQVVLGVVPAACDGGGTRRVVTVDRETSAGVISDGRQLAVVGTDAVAHTHTPSVTQTMIYRRAHRQSHRPCCTDAHTVSHTDHDVQTHTTSVTQTMMYRRTHTVIHTDHDVQTHTPSVT